MSDIDDGHIPTNEELIKELLDRKLTATADEQRKIRQQLRKLGYSLRAHSAGGGGDISNLPKHIPKPGAKRPPEKNNNGLLARVAPSPHTRYHAHRELTPEAITALIETLSVEGLQYISQSDFDKDTKGYGFDLYEGFDFDEYRKSFVKRWNYEPEWFCVLNRDNPGVKILLLGPVV